MIPSLLAGGAVTHNDKSDKKIARVLITGATGFVGRHAMAAFARALGSDRGMGLGRSEVKNNPQGLAYYSVDLLDKESILLFIDKHRPSHVLHLAGLSSVQRATHTPIDAWRTNLCGLLNLVEAVAIHIPNSVFLYTSSGEVYGRSFLSGESLNEQSNTLPANGYALTKLAGEQMLADILPTAGVKTIILRPFNHIGRGQDERFVAASFAGQIARIEAGHAEHVITVGDLSVQRDFLDVQDVVDAYYKVTLAADGIPNCTIFNIASGRARPISDIVDGLRILARVPFTVRIDPSRLRSSEIPIAKGDASALTTSVGWEPQVGWDQTLAALLDDARSQVSFKFT